MKEETDIDTIRERIAIEVEHMPDADAQAEYERRIAIDQIEAEI